jgi:hypothetical protein
LRAPHATNQNALPIVPKQMRVVRCKSIACTPPAARQVQVSLREQRHCLRTIDSSAHHHRAANVLHTPRRGERCSHWPGRSNPAGLKGLHRSCHCAERGGARAGPFLGSKTPV